jgi:hypothetical protein
MPCVILYRATKRTHIQTIFILQHGGESNYVGSILYRTNKNGMNFVRRYRPLTSWWPLVCASEEGRYEYWGNQESEYRYRSTVGGKVVTT